jgi:hypothetical protein
VSDRDAFRANGVDAREAARKAKAQMDQLREAAAKVESGGGNPPSDREQEDPRAAFREAREAGLVARHEKRLEAATYTAAEVKVLTETATRLGREIGRKEALEEVARAMGIDRWDDEPREYVDVTIDWDTYTMLQEALGAVSDEHSGEDT